MFLRFKNGDQATRVASKFIGPVLFVKRAHAFLLLIGMSFPLMAGAADKTISYNRDIRPILSDNCFYCHGPDAGKRKAKLRLDVRDEAISHKAFVPGKPKESEIVRRIFSNDPEELMPPPDSNKKLTPEQKELLRRWIAADAKYEGHWAYQKPIKPAIPAGANPIDFLVQKRLKAVGLKPSAEADHRTLARRLYFDLTGLPPQPEEVDAFIHDRSRDATSRLVEKLLASPHYGECMAIPWLDEVRFADTIGYHSDNPRNIWPYRDYVIKAFNENKPFDVFTREQLAGDLLPLSGQEQKVASAYNRLLLTTEEGGAQPKDYEARMLTDRVRAVANAWLGQTIGCAQCHDHKFDPITSRDFYSLGAFFADIQETIIGAREVGMAVPNEEQAVKLAALQTEVKRLQADYHAPHQELHDAFVQWEQLQSQAAVLDRLWSVLIPVQAHSTGKPDLEIKSDHSVLVVANPKPDKDVYSLVFSNLPPAILGLRIEALTNSTLPAQGPGCDKDGNFVLTRITARIEHADGKTETVTFSAAHASFEQTTQAETHADKSWSAASTIDANAKEESAGWAILPQAGKPQLIVLECEHPVSLITNDVLKVELIQNNGSGRTLGCFRVAVTTDATAVHGPFAYPPAKDLADLLVVPSEKREKAQQNKIWQAFKKVTPELAELRNKMAVAEKDYTSFEASLPHCIISIAAEKPRIVRILPRGNFLVETGDVVNPALPGYLKASWKTVEKTNLTRLDLANWLVSKENPLTARVTMNRLWKQFFGVGVAKSLDDFGAQGEPPKNQELIDWLACEFMDSGWDLKHMVRLMVESRTYRQTSVPSAKARAVDPYNREFSSQGRWRLDAELVRDNALTIAGLLAPKVGGPSVKPYQPDGYWENLNFPPRTWEQSPGDNQYRRGLYTWWQRSFVQPSLLAFDAPTREECVAERNRSNIPQQALTLLNDPTYVEAARVFAARIIQTGSDPKARLRWAWEHALDREPRRDETATTLALLEQHLTDYRSDPKAADAVLHVGVAPIPESLDHVELAAWTGVARVILNLHETITRN